MHNAQCAMHNAECTTHNAQCAMQNAQCRMHNTLVNNVCTVKFATGVPSIVVVLQGRYDSFKYIAKLQSAQ